MTPLAGFAIALLIGLTGIGGGVLTTPVLILFLGMAAPEAVGTALVFVTIVKLVAAPLFIWRGQVNYRILALLLAGGLPGALLGSMLLHGLKFRGFDGLLHALLGAMIVVSAAVNLLRRSGHIEGRDRRMRLPFISLPIGVEVGFSSAGAGALGSLALMNWTKLKGVEVIGTDLAYGLALSASAGSIHLSSGGVNLSMLRELVSGGIPGALMGAWLANVVPAPVLRKGLSLWLIWLGGALCWRGLWA